MAQHVVARNLAVIQPERPCHAGAGRRQGRESQLFQPTDAADVPRVRQHEAAFFVKRAKGCPLGFQVCHRMSLPLRAYARASRSRRARLRASVPQTGTRLSLGVVKNDAERVPVPGPHPADAVAQVDPVVASRTTDRAVMDREHGCIALAQRQDLRSRLHARALLGQHELAASVVPAGLGQQGSPPGAGRRDRRRGPGAGSCSRPRRTAGGAASAASARRHGNARGIRRARPDSARRSPSARSSGWRSAQDEDRAPFATLR